jgi:hypothetical protein
MNNLHEAVFFPSFLDPTDPNNPLGLPVGCMIRIRDWLDSGLGIMMRRREDGRGRIRLGLVGEAQIYMGTVLMILSTGKIPSDLQKMIHGMDITKKIFKIGIIEDMLFVTINNHKKIIIIRIKKQQNQ